MAQPRHILPFFLNFIFSEVNLNGTEAAERSQQIQQVLKKNIRKNVRECLESEPEVPKLKTKEMAGVFRKFGGQRKGQGKKE
jgi:hypothetical protein